MKHRKLISNYLYRFDNRKYSFHNPKPNQDNDIIPTLIFGVLFIYDYYSGNNYVYKSSLYISDKIRNIFRD